MGIAVNRTCSVIRAAISPFATRDVAP